MATQPIVGTKYRAKVTFKDPDTGAFVDPTTFVFSYRLPVSKGLITLTMPNSAIVKNATGQYTVIFNITEPGTYHTQANTDLGLQEAEFTSTNSEL